jgi:hypothetical protein
MTIPADDRTQTDSDDVTTRQAVVSREKEEFGGFRFGSAFFGWLAATGATAVLGALLGAVAAAVGLGSGASRTEMVDTASENAATIGLAGAITILVVLLISYFCGGYVAGRMARFSGAKQGIAVWLWAVLITLVLAIVGAIAGSQLTVPDSLSGLSLDLGDLTTAGIITAVGAIVVSLGGAVLGGLAGMRFHRRVDRAGLGR